MNTLLFFLNTRDGWEVEFAFLSHYMGCTAYILGLHYYLFIKGVVRDWSGGRGKNREVSAVLCPRVSESHERD